MKEKKRKERKAKREKKISTFFSDFKKFIAKGNVVDLAVAVIIGAAFNKIVSSLVADIITPLISLAMGQVDFKDLAIILREAVMDGETIVTPALTLNYGQFIQYIIDFLVIAFTVFILVKVITGIQKTMDLNANMTKLVQEKLDKNEELNDFEQKWLTRYTKKYPNLAPKKKEVVAPEEPKAPELSTTDKLLTEILVELQKDKKPKKTKKELATDDTKNS